ncbi:ribosome maturation factor RimP [Caldinitratiruptor microaerophilus]|uniref:Ribosome maturation factor RimP n=1 Tax=Caldinitratiruptor microaerophilus TaxID=671077 RepID=A0AA35CJ99_9FIRM|nr:ribosome maturation factor RimP [Caldinitratiruptor microaerophilus]BDG59398.1 ribosome maturation factor RimP [Caldinitratiruptor microaerophilus]
MSNKVEVLVEDLVRPVVEAMGIELVAVEYVREAGRRFLRLYIDKPGGVNLDDCEAVSRRAEVLLDQEDPIPESYYLEVSSPGLERPLRKDADFERFAGRRVRITTYSPVGGRRRFEGELLGLSEGRVRLRVAPQGKGEPEEVAIPREQVASARLRAEF